MHTKVCIKRFKAWSCDRFWGVWFVKGHVSSTKWKYFHGSNTRGERMTGFLGTDEFKSMTSWQRSWGRNTITMSAAILRCKWDSCVIRAVHLWLSRICSLQIHSCSYL